MIISCLFIKDTTQKGRGIFTNEAIDADTIIEMAPVIVMPKNDRVYLDKTLLHDYIFEWGDDEEQSCIGLGMISIYNHSYHSNCDYFMDYEEQTMIIKTVRSIIAWEEITINYNGDWNNGKKMWFDVK